MNWKLIPHKDLNTDFIAAVFIIAKPWEQPRCASVGEWINGDTSRQWECSKEMSYQARKNMEKH